MIGNSVIRTPASSIALAIAAAGGIANRLVEEADAAAQEIVAGGGRAVALSVDLAQTKAIPDLVHKVVRQWGRIDVLVNNAWIAGRTAPEALAEEQWERLMTINLKAVFFLTLGKCDKP